MFAIRRSCAAALRSPLAHNTTRAFSRSAACQRGGLPVFLEPSSPELSALLAQFNSKVLLPYHLSNEQKKLVYSRAGQAKLQSEPVDITVGDVSLPLEPLDRNNLPKRFTALHTIMRSSSTPQDWENVIRAIEGLESAGIRVNPGWQELVARKLAQHQMHGLLLKTLQRPKATAMRLSNLGLLRAVLRAVHDRAVGYTSGRNAPPTWEGSWDQDKTAASLRFANQVVELIEDPEHHAVKPTNELVPHTDLRSRPSVVALPTELAAVAAERHGADVEPVKALATRLVASLKQTKFMAEVDQIADFKTNFPSKTTQAAGLSALARDLTELLIVWNALATSRRVLGAAMPQADAAAAFEARIESVLKKGISVMEKLSVRDGVTLSNVTTDYIKTGMQRCRPAAQ